MSDFDMLLAAGGRPEYAAGASPGDQDAVTLWNFGITLPPAGRPVTAPLPTLYDTIPNIQGRWDGKTTINHNRAVRLVTGTDLKAQYQRRGTCGGRAGTRGLDLLQCIMIASGKRAKFKPTSHAWLYYRARREWNMLGGGDGVAGGSIPEVMEKYGVLSREECGDTDFDSPRTDDLAVAWGAGQISRSDEEKYTALAKDNVVTARLRVRSAQELADGIAAGGVGVGSDMQGFTMTRDSEGVCAPSGVWSHYHDREGVALLPSGRKVFAYGQSWGANCPNGPKLLDFPDNVFGVPWDVQDYCCKSGQWDILFVFNLFEIENDKIDMSWMF